MPKGFFILRKTICLSFNLDHAAAAAAAKSLQSCPTLRDPREGSPPGSPVPRILQARTLEWVAVSFSNAWKWKWSCSVVSDPQRPHGLQPTRLLHPWDFPGKSIGVGCHCLLRTWIIKTYKNIPLTLVILHGDAPILFYFCNVFPSFPDAIFSNLFNSFLKEFNARHNLLMSRHSFFRVMQNPE